MKLESSIGASLGPASVFVLVKITDIARPTWLEKKDSKGKASSNIKPGVRQMLGKNRLHRRSGVTSLSTP